MPVAVYVAPLFRPNTNRFLRGFAELPGVRLGVVGMDDPLMLDEGLRSKVAAFVRVKDAMDPEQLAQAGWELRTRLGGLDVLTGSLEELQIPVAVARDRLGVLGITEGVARNFREKARMKDVLRGAGVPVARHRLVHSVDDARRFAGEVGYPIVAKPPAGLGARATWRVGDEAELLAALRAFQVSASDPVQCEEFVSGRENTCETVMIRGEAVWHSGTHYLNAPLEVLENPWMQYCVMLPKPEGEEFRRFHPVNDAALAALGLDTGLSHLEWFLRADGRPVVSEVGARPPGANIMPLMSAAFDVDFVRKWCELTVFGTFDPPTRKYSVGTAFFRGQGTGRVSAVRGLAQAQEEVGEWVIDRKLPQIGQPRSTSYEGEGWAIVRGADDATVLHALRRLVELVRVEYGG